MIINEKIIKVTKLKYLKGGTIFKANIRYNSNEIHIRTLMKFNEPKFIKCDGNCVYMKNGMLCKLDPEIEVMPIDTMEELCINK